MIRIVIVEDMPIVREGLRMLLGRIKDFEVIGEFENGKIFIDNIKVIEPNIVLTDIDMPLMNGIEATQIATSLMPDLKVIGLSMYSDRKYYYKMITAGAKGFVLKQSTSKDLECAIREVYEGRNYFSAELLHNVIVEMHGLDEEIVKNKKNLLKISDRETQILQLLCQGLSNKELADKLFVSIRTIETSKARLMEKTMAKNTAGLIIWAIKNKVVAV